MVDRTKETVNGAVATVHGWVDPKSGELLVSIRGLSDAINWTRKDGLEALQEKLKKRQPEPKVAVVSKEAAEALKEAHGLDAEAEIKEILKDEKVEVVVTDKTAEKAPAKEKKSKTKAKKAAE